jgi:putative ABC transport system ATP-binding protein
VRALAGVSLTVQAGEFVGLLGPSGSGKSTLLNLIAGLDSPTAGHLRVLDRDLAALSRSDLSQHRQKTVGMIFQSFNLVPSMTALENVALSMMFAGVPRRERDHRAGALLDAVGLGGRGAHRPRELSGGEQQRVSIARALANQPALVLADEPAGNRQQTTREIMIRGPQRARGQTIIMVTRRGWPPVTRRTVTMLDGAVLSGHRADVPRHSRWRICASRNANSPPTLGVSIGIAFLSGMVSFGVGLGPTRGPFCAVRSVRSITVTAAMPPASGAPEDEGAALET